MFLEVIQMLQWECPMSHFYTPISQKTYDFRAFSGGIEMWHWTKMG